MLNRMIAFLHGSAPLALKRILAPVARRLATRFARLPIDVAVGAMRLRCRFTDNYSEKKFVFTPWRYDAHERLTIRNHLPDDGVFVDIGTNVGIYTLTAADSLGPSGTIVSFEPHEPTLRRLCFNLRASEPQRKDWPRIFLFDIGIAEAEKEFTLQLDAGNLGASSIVNSADGDSTQTAVIRCRPLLDVLTEVGVDHIDILKIDIEGAEDVALVPFLQSNESRLLPRWIIIENSSDKWSVDLFALFSDYGYAQVHSNRMNSIFRRST